MGLYGGLGAQDIHRRKGLKKSEQILDHMGTTELAANLFRATQSFARRKPRTNSAAKKSPAKIRLTKPTARLEPKSARPST